MSAPDRRAFLARAGLPAAGLLFDPAGLARALDALAVPDPRPPAQAALDEDFWAEVARAFALDRSFVNLNHGGVSPAPQVVLEAMGRHVAFSNHAPSYTMWQVLQPQRESVRAGLARLCGLSPDEVAITRNASEALQTCQQGFDLRPGDEVLTTSQDYPRMLDTFRQRARRDGIVLRLIDLHVPAEDPAEVVRRFVEAITPATKLILMCHMINLTGQVLPVREVVAAARERGVPVIVDGAHAFAHLDVSVADLGCDYYGTSLHKWLNAPIGTGMLCVRKEQIAGLWPLMAARAEQDGDIRKFEETGTRPEAPALAIAEALTFHEAIGGARKLARMIALRDRWARPLAGHERVRLFTSLKPGLAGGIATVGLDGVPTDKLHKWLWERRGIWTTPIQHGPIDGLRVSPGICNTPLDVDRFSEALDHALRHGLS